MSRQTRTAPRERPALSDDEFWDKIARHHLAIAALIRQWRGMDATDSVNSVQQVEAPTRPRFIGSQSN